MGQPGSFRDVYKGTTTLIGRAAARGLAAPGSALVVLLIGTSVYLLDREWSAVLFLAPFAAFQGGPADLFGTIGHVLPAFCHAYAFSLFLILVLGRSRHARVAGACSWFGIAAVLEILQAERFSAMLASFTGLTATAPVLNSLNVYLVNGRFDFGDLGAAGLGCIIAFLVAPVSEEVQ